MCVCVRRPWTDRNSTKDEGPERATSINATYENCCIYSNKTIKKCHTHDPNRFFLFLQFGLCLTCGTFVNYVTSLPLRDFLQGANCTSMNLFRRPFTRQSSMTNFMHVPLFKIGSKCFSFFSLLPMFIRSVVIQNRPLLDDHARYFFVWISKAARSWIVLGGFLFDTWQNWFARSHFFLLMIHEQQRNKATLTVLLKEINLAS